MSDEPVSENLSPQDTQFIQRLREGENEAIAELQQRFGDELRLFCVRMLRDPGLAEDVVQDVFFTCCRVDPESRPQSSVRGWLYQIARRRCIDIHRKRQGPDPVAARGKRRVQPTYDNAIDPLTTPAGKALKIDRASKVLELVHDLDEDLRSVIIMRYFQDLPRDEIAEAIGLSLAGTKARLSKAMNQLREKMAALDDSGT